MAAIGVASWQLRADLDPSMDPQYDITIRTSIPVVAHGIAPTICWRPIAERTSELARIETRRVHMPISTVHALS